MEVGKEVVMMMFDGGCWVPLTVAECKKEMGKEMDDCSWGFTENREGI